MVFKGKYLRLLNYNYRYVVSVEIIKFFIISLTDEFYLEMSNFALNFRFRILNSPKQTLIHQLIVFVKSNACFCLVILSRRNFCFE